jgi:hypothetical protein
MWPPLPNLEAASLCAALLRHPTRFEAIVERASQSTRRWDVILAGDQPPRGHVPLDTAPPRPADRVGVRLEATPATVITPQSQPSCVTEGTLGVGWVI